MGLSLQNHDIHTFRGELYQSVERTPIGWAVSCTCETECIRIARTDDSMEDHRQPCSSLKMLRPARRYWAAAAFICLCASLRVQLTGAAESLHQIVGPSVDPIFGLIPSLGQTNLRVGQENRELQGSYQLEQAKHPHLASLSSRNGGRHFVAAAPSGPEHTLYSSSSLVSAHQHLKSVPAQNGGVRAASETQKGASSMTQPARAWSGVETAASIRRGRRSLFSILRSRLRPVGHALKKKARFARKMFDVMILQFRDRRALQLIPEDITGQELWELANGGRAVTGRMEQLGRIVGSKLEYPVPVISCEEHQEASLETLKPAPFLSRSSTKASENDSEAMDVANSVEWDLQDSDSVPLLASPSPVSSVQTMAEARAIYEENVRQFSIAKSSDMASRMRDLKGSKPLNIVMLQWNTELFKPTPFEFLLPFCRKSPEEEEAPVIKLEGIDMFVVTTQENNRFSPGEELIMQDSILRGLNALSQIPNWKSSGLRQLNNARGTLLRRFAPFTPNTQMIMWFARDHAVFNKPPEFCMGSLKQSEKGFVAVKAAVEGVGNILIAGTHIGHRKSRRNQISEVLQMMGTNCGEEARGHTGLDDFSIVLLAGDFNSRLDLDSSRELLSVISKEPPFTSPFVGDSANPIRGSDLMKSLWAGYSASTHVFHSRVVPVLHALDSMQPAPIRDGREISITVPLREAGFSSASVCYQGGFSYPWLKGCRPCPKGQCSEASLKSMMERCFSRAGLDSPSASGFLDRLVIRTTGGSSAFIRKSHIYFNMRSDHLPYTFEISLFGSPVSSAS